MSGRFEEALQRTQGDVEVAIKAVQSVGKALKKVKRSIQTGDVKPVTKQMEAVEQALTRFEEAFQASRDGWDFDEESYFNSEEFFHEILAEAKAAGVDIYEMDGRLFCYPSIIKLLPSDRAVIIDKKREKRLRPSVLVKKLFSIQNKPARFRPDAFLESLQSAYLIIIAQKNKKVTGTGPDIPLLDIYKILTLLPGQAREYSRQEFARDIYLLDQSNVMVARNGFRASFQASSGTRAASRCLNIVTRDGQEKLYYSISFTREN